MATSRTPILPWLQAQAEECLIHIREAGEMITHVGEHPSLAIGFLLETHQYDIGDILHGNRWVANVRCWRVTKNCCF
ncbi:hypothetical protein SAMN05216302_101227 [Nitrosomonas aestuarii]|uniref:Uncharacterized protein n=1 Tax=Nitrosomonas aestuarii TaxID=52441 RepID=A0A1I4BJ17_9PROT|nr:hypothetical protein SAMN05216302_101227 [Nitrosomonas aestuarii]